MKPRYRKSPPEFRKFKNKKEQNEFFNSYIEAQKLLHMETAKTLKPFGFKEINHTNPSEERTKSLKILLDKIDKFCPHFHTAIPTFKHSLMPVIGVASCMECLIGFYPLLLADESGCDLCGVGGKLSVYREISIPIGYGFMMVNLGTNCCADIFVKN